MAEKTLGLLGTEAITAYAGNLDWDYRLEGKTLGEKTILFPRPQSE